MTAVQARVPGQIVLVLQGGGALGAYQLGVYQALHEAGLEPDWVIGTSIGAINGAIIAGNRLEDRLVRLRELWQRVGQAPSFRGWQYWPGMREAFAELLTLVQGIAGFCSPRASLWGGVQAKVGLERASFYCSEPLRATLCELVDFRALNAGRPRLTVGAVHVESGAMCYFDSRRATLDVEHVMASGALPPGLPAVRVKGEPYWDGGLYSNTPLEAVLDDHPRRDSLIFSVNVWQQTGHEPASIWQAVARQKDIQYASRADSHIARQKQIHHLRHVIRELARRVPEGERNSAEGRELASWGCHTTMHVVRLLAPQLDGEDYMKDLDFSETGIRCRREAGFADARSIIERAPWETPVDPMEGVIVHELSARTGG